MANIHPLACVDAGAEMDSSVEVGPFCVVEAGVIIGAVVIAIGLALIYVRRGEAKATQPDA